MLSVAPGAVRQCEENVEAGSTIERGNARVAVLARETRLDRASDPCTPVLAFVSTFAVKAIVEEDPFTNAFGKSFVSNRVSLHPLQGL